MSAIYPTQPSEQLLEKYDVPAPRYTSYPTVPHWQEQKPSPIRWKYSVRKSIEGNPEISVYIHLPFCERLCTYCGCNKRITRRHSVEEPYIKALLQEWRFYVRTFPQKPILKELHLGGGTPTFFSPENLEALLLGIMEDTEIPEEHYFGFEAHPSNTTLEHLQVLRKIGFARISIGIQDFNQEILQLINRFQTEEQIVFLTEEARKLGYNSINYDLIFGLPKQTAEDIRYSIDKIATLRPDRIAFYSYAHVPWAHRGQRAYDESDLPSPTTKRGLYELGKQLLLDQGYIEIGLDHFALPTDSLAIAAQDGTLHRNFMGYTTSKSNLLVGLGASAISETKDMYVQNVKKVGEYQAGVSNYVPPILKGHILSAEDMATKESINAVMCNQKVSLQQVAVSQELLEDKLAGLKEDGLLQINNDGILEVTKQGLPFLRNICVSLDPRMQIPQSAQPTFSKSI